MEFNKLTPIQQNILAASILGDGEITKLYKGSRRKNNSYREHYGAKQKEYREWKQAFLPELLYLTPQSCTLRSSSQLLFTELYPYFYDNGGNKQIPQTLLRFCDLPHFLAALYMDDGTLCITKRINHKKSIIYLTPSIMLALQNFPRKQLELLCQHIQETFNFTFHFLAVKDGKNVALKFTSVKDTFAFLDYISPVTASCPSMYYKTNWAWRFQKEKSLLEKLYPGYDIIASCSERYRNYSNEEIEMLLKLKEQGYTVSDMASALGRTYWSVTYKLRELRAADMV
ncbi:DNA endonuclease [Bacillus sp. UMB0728]|uniref:DNA endonuclease n=1 Tax=Bacillus sp. UMB0728 TaxID=2066052 RepID=UPI000C7877B2|nr:DNA endonuclease [Bacillus sp. UMB0728]PLR73719.1 DNA endonuclease [Bacillus sp. UMB0728]